VRKDAAVRLLEANPGADGQSVEMPRELQVMDELRAAPHEVADDAHSKAGPAQDVEYGHDVLIDIPR
jgi:hypothetical protein